MRFLKLMPCICNVHRVRSSCFSWCIFGTYAKSNASFLSVSIVQFLSGAGGNSEVAAINTNLESLSYQTSLIVSVLAGFEVILYF